MATYTTTIIGGGPAGMMAAIQAAKAPGKVTVLEKNSQLGKKLLLTGKGRCNLSTSKSKQEIIEAFDETCNGKFLWDSLNQLDNRGLRSFFEQRNLKIKEERGQRLFPVTDRASSVLDVLKKELKRKGIEIQTNTTVKNIVKENRVFSIKTNRGTLHSQKVILATGGKSYPKTGSTGEGYTFCKKLGHTITPLKGSLVPLESPNKEIRKLQGLSLKNVTLSLFTKNKLITKQFGEMLFTHFGISGPIVLEASRFYNSQKHKNLQAILDFKPALDKSLLDKRLLREIEDNPYLDYKNMLKNLLPSKIITLTVKKTAIKPHTNISQLTMGDRKKIINFLKRFSFSISKPLPIEEAIITSGGVNLDEVKPKTMESKVCPNFFIAGELLNLDGPTGGFNLQMCFTTGFVAGKSAKIK